MILLYKIIIKLQLYIRQIYVHIYIFTQCYVSSYKNSYTQKNISIYNIQL